MQVLENALFKVTIKELGAELCSMKSKADGTEYVWQADPDGWARHAPLLFPIIGRLKEQRYTLDGTSYDITMHGFGRDLPFEVRRVSEACVEFTLTQSDFTKKMYPWDFLFTVRYTLDGAALKKEHIMVNRDSTTLYYEVGGHDAYALCLLPGEQITDYRVEFEGTNALHPILTDENVFLSQQHGDVPLENGALPITRETFKDDAMILDDLPVRRVSIASSKSDKRITVDFADFPYLGLWSPYKDFDVQFVCIEPWSTLPDGGYLGYELAEKVGIRRLAPGQAETLTFTTTITE